MSRQDELSVCIDHIEELKDAGYRTLVDPCPNDVGRDVDFIGEVAARTGFNIICATGLFNQHAGSNTYWVVKSQADPHFVDRLADIMIGELTQGVRGTGIRPGVIKLATGKPPMSDYERKVFAAGAKASRATGVPITTHTDAVLGDVQLEYLTALGVAPNKIIIGHCCGSTDHEYHMKLIEAGAYVGFDRFGIESICSDETRIEAMLKVLRKGVARQLIVSHDCVWCMRGNMMGDAPFEDKSVHHPLRFERVIAPKLIAAGVSTEVIAAMLLDNPRRYFAGETL
jgi:phosphotriesterase-related protein